jgi:hypothetical protein
LKNAEIHYDISEKECLAIVWAIKQFRIYLRGLKFTVVTDHNALVWLISIRDPTGKLARWSIYLQQYNYEIIHRKGRIHSNVDTLSRRVLTCHTVNSTGPYTMATDPYNDEAFLHYLQFGRHLQGQSSRKCKNVVDKAKHYKFQDDKLWFRKDVTQNTYLEVPTRQQRYDIIKREHLLGHFQSATVDTAISQKYFWPKMRDDITHFIQRCVPCNRNHPIAMKEHSAQAINPVNIFDRICADLIVGLPETHNGYCGILLITEYLTKFPYAFPIKSKNATEKAQKTV